MSINNSKYKYLLILFMILVVAIFIYVYWPHSQNSAQTNNISLALPNIPTPAGWYDWGTSHYPDYQTSTIPNSMTFGNQPMNNGSSGMATLININVQDQSNKTDEQWINTVLYPTIEGLGSTTSTRLWNVINNRLILEAVTQTPAGGVDLNYYVFNNGVIYSFSLNPTRPEGNIFTSSDGQTLQIMVQDFTESLPDKVVSNS